MPRVVILAPTRTPRAGELGSAVVTARLARDLMCLWLLMNRRYPPYSKWLGTAFAQVPGAAGLGASLAAALSATGWPDRERHLSRMPWATCAAREPSLPLSAANPAKRPGRDLCSR